MRAAKGPARGEGALFAPTRHFVVHLSGQLGCVCLLALVSNAAMKLSAYML